MKKRQTRNSIIEECASVARKTVMLLPNPKDYGLRYREPLEARIIHAIHDAACFKIAAAIRELKTASKEPPGPLPRKD